MNIECLQFLQPGLSLAYEYTIIDDNEGIQDILIKMIDLTRYCFDTKEQLIIIRQEIQKIEAFLSLQEIRFRDDFIYTIGVDEQLNAQVIHKFFLLQPVIEFFYSKIEMQIGKKQMDIKIYLIENNVGMEIKNTTSDNVANIIYIK